MEILELPSRTLPQRNMLAPESILRDLRAFIDVDVVWDCDEGSWLVLERCANPRRWARVNGRLLRGWRHAAWYQDEDGAPFALDQNIVPWLRRLDIAAFDHSLATFEDAKYGVAEKQERKIESDRWARAAEKARDKFKTALGSRGVRKTKQVGSLTPLFSGAPSRWGR